MNVLQIKLLYSPKLKHQLLIGAIISVWLWLFLFFTEPLDVKELTSSEKMKFLLGYALLLWVSYSITIPFQKRLFVRRRNSWIWLDELLTLLTLAAVMYGLTYSFYRFIVIPNEPNPHTLWFFFTHRFMPIFVVVIPMLWGVRWASGVVHQLLEKSQEKGVSAPQKISLKGENQREVLQINPQDLVYMEAASNYVKIHYLVGEELQQVMFRNKLSVYEKALGFLVKPHRSYLVNPRYFLKFRQENKKHKLVLSLQNIELPVSKNLLETVESQIISSQ